jgi:hypothetical protein
MVLSAHALESVQVRMKSVSNGWHFTLEFETLLVHISAGIGVGTLSNTA